MESEKKFNIALYVDDKFNRVFRENLTFEEAKHQLLLLVDINFTKDYRILNTPYLNEKLKEQCYNI